MKAIYVHTLRYHFGRGNRASRTMFPVSYGPFSDEETAWEWVRQTGITRATKLMSAPANENVDIPPKYLAKQNNQEFRVFPNTQMQQNSML